MSSFLSGLVLLVVFAMLVAALPIAYAAWRRIGARGEDLQIWKMMRRRGIATSEAPSNPAELARAVRRCVLCPSIEACDEFLASGSKDATRFCPNDALLAKLEREKDLGKSA